MRKEDITYQDKLNELRLDISHPNNKSIAFILLEGQSDIRLFRKLFNLDKCKVENIPGGKFKLEECVGNLVAICPLVIGIRDADFLHLNTPPYNYENMFLTDLHDMEIMLVSEEEIFKALIFEYTSIPENKHLEVRDKIMHAIADIGFLRWLNDLECLELVFESGFTDLISFANLEIDFIQYINRVLAKSPNAKIKDVSLICSKIESLKSHSPHIFQLTNGHDFIKALTKYLREECHVPNIHNDGICSSFRMAFRIQHFMKTKLFHETNIWANKNNCVIYNASV